jgi:predicted AlkP superfamily phosphohydrolase/phosphomutase
VNRWLQDLGLLTLKPGQAWRKRLFYEAMRLEAAPLVQRLLPTRLRSAVRRRIRRTFSSFKTDVEAVVDMAATQAYFASMLSQGIYINVKRDGLGVVEPGAAYDELRAYIREKLYELSNPRTGQTVVDRVWYREEVYYGDQVALAPDLLFVARDYAFLGRQLFGSRAVIDPNSDAGKGFHRMNGIFLAYGSDIQAGLCIEGAQIADIAPTVLYAMNLPVPNDMDGRVLTEIWQPGRRAAQPVEFVPAGKEEIGFSQVGYSASEVAAVEARLDALGYLD